jgi:hypothetical protein
MTPVRCGHLVSLVILVILNGAVPMPPSVVVASAIRMPVASVRNPAAAVIVIPMGINSRVMIVDICLGIVRSQHTEYG